MSFTEILEFNFINVGGYHLNLIKLISATLILIGARILIAFIFSTFLKRFFKKRSVDIGRRYAIEQFLKYIIYTLALLAALQAVGVQFSVLLGGAAALLVGIGLGLQQTFNDLISGVILLGEGTVEVGDIVKVDGIVGKVTSIGIRTSKVETRDEISIIIPNSKLVVDNVVNWSHNESPTRFNVGVGVSYESDIQLVTKLLLQAAEEHPDILKEPTPKVQFKDFGSSSLDFELLFYSTAYLRIEFIKSELRYRIMELFRTNKIEIPFPQRDLWIRNSLEIKGKE
jgi:small-conductance mechanosensitive channel